MIYGFSPFGYEGQLVGVEAETKEGVSATDIIGLQDGCVESARKAVRSACVSSGFKYPEGHVLVSLRPAELRKAGTGFDLPIVLAVLSCSDEYPRSQDAAVIAIGELEQSGIVRNVNAVYAALETARNNGIRHAIVPRSANLEVPSGISVTEVGSLEEAYHALCAIDEAEALGSDCNDASDANDKFSVEFDDIGGDSLDELDDICGLKFAMAVAAAGRHSLLAVGSPGCGKTALLSLMPQLMPKLLQNERGQVRRIYSIAGLSACSPFKDGARPFRTPHHTASIEGICGGGPNCRPGEISLAHNGVLFLDEAAEFRTSVLQMLRIPLESDQIVLSRAGHTTVFPAKFQLLMAANPCPCGNFGSATKLCLCSSRSIENYWKKISAPLLDRIAIKFDCSDTALIGFSDMKLDELRECVRKACIAQYTRQGKPNQDLSPEEVARRIRMTADGEKKLEEVANENGLSAMGIANLKKVAQTMCDMFGYEEIDKRIVRTALRIYGRHPLVRLTEEGGE